MPLEVEVGTMIVLEDGQIGHRDVHGERVELLPVGRVVLELA